MIDDFSQLPGNIKDARTLGEKRYFTGKPCKHGHVAPRITDNATCVVCHGMRVRTWQDHNGGKVSTARSAWRKQDHVRAKELEYKRKWGAKNPELVKAMKQREYEKNKDRISATQKTYYAENREKISNRRKEWARNNIDAIKIAYKRYYETNYFKIKEAAKEYRVKNKEIIKIKRKENIAYYVAKAVARSLKQKNRTPKWANFDKIKELYDYSSYISNETGVRHHVDHIVPLQGENVCGLHVEYNLRVITAKENLEKHNKLIEDIL